MSGHRATMALVKPPKPCVVHRCPEYAEPGLSRCRTHEAEYQAERAKQPVRGARGTDAEWRRARQQRMIKDRYECQRCGRGLAQVQREGGRLHVHHVDDDPSDHSIDKLETLCDRCHKEIPTVQSKARRRR